MPLMDDTWYLPEEDLYYRNYPELSTVEGELDELVTYAMRLGNAVDDYNNSLFNRMDINVVDLQKYISLCRTVSEVLGVAPRVCYDLLVELRELQDVMQSLLYTYRRYGSEYIGTPDS